MIYEKSQNLSQRLPGCKIIFFITVIFTNSCSPLKFTKTQPGQPKKEYYSFSREVNNNIVHIDTNSIYVNEQEWVQTGDYGTRKKYLYVFMKFSSNGIAYYSNYNEQAFTETSILNIGGQYCYYRVDNDELLLEFYDHLAKKFKVWRAKIYPDRLQFYEYKLKVWGGAKGKLNFVFYKRPIKYTSPLVWPE